MKTLDFTGNTLSDPLMDGTFRATIEQILRFHVKQVEDALKQRFMEILGRMPDDREIQNHCTCLIHPNGTREFVWQGEVILTILPFQFHKVE